MKKFFALLLVLLVSQVAFAQNGDINNDGVVTSADVTVLYNFLLNGDTSDLINWDQDGDGVITVSDVTSVYNILLGMPTHEYVDLGLPSGTLWATMNIGANSPEEYGDYFAWGETMPKDVYGVSTYKWFDSSSHKLTKYCTNSSDGHNGFVDDKTELDPEDDAATANWGEMWRMPSLEQIQELANNCTTQWTTINEVNGVLFTSNINGASLFVPASGYHENQVLSNAGFSGSYWTRTLYSHFPLGAFNLFFVQNQNYVQPTLSGERTRGHSVRAVRVSQK